MIELEVGRLYKTRNNVIIRVDEITSSDVFVTLFHRSYPSTKTHSPLYKFECVNFTYATKWDEKFVRDNLTGSE